MSVTDKWRKGSEFIVVGKPSGCAKLRRLRLCVTESDASDMVFRGTQMLLLGCCSA
jgi:hypothetical protein